jgi:hypothetical protein
MRFVRVPFELVWVVSAIAICYGQGAGKKPDPSGTWEFDRNRSNVGKSSKSADPPEQLTITYRDPELKIHRTIFVNGQRTERDSTYYTDGQGEANPTTTWVTTNPGADSDRPPETESRTSWSGAKIVTRSKARPHAGTAVLEFEIIVEWKVSGDGKTLTQTTHTVAQRDPMSNSVFVGGGRDLKAVYNLVSK